MIRDQIKDEQYFSEYIEQQEKRINNFQNKLDRDEVALDRVFAVREKIDSLSFQILIAEYSMGKPVENLVNHYKKLVTDMKEFWVSTSGYVDMLWMTSIGIMLEVDDETFDILAELVNEAGWDDYLISYLLQTRNSSISLSEKKFLFETPYKHLFDVINGGREQATSSLKSYLENEWYRGHNDTGWFDNHKNQQKLYYGYWSFESGAIAKILQLDDSSLKDAPYYPYDMVHYQGS